MMTEAIIEPDRPIVDAHHHLYDRPGKRYLLDDFAADLDSGHAVVATVLVQARHGYDTAAGEQWAPVGETRFARRMAEAAGRRNIAAAVVPFADLTLGDAVRPVLDAHLTAGEGRVRGIRHILAWDRNPARLNPAYPTSEAMMDDIAFRAGFRHLAPLGLSFDAWVLYPQLPRLARLAGDFPDTAIVVDHCGGPIMGDTDVFATWRTGMRALAERSNVSVKLSGLGMPSAGFAKAERARDLAAAWRPWMETCIELFGAGRAMFASNFPADRPGHGYAMGWNAMKLVAAGASDVEKDRLFRGTATRFYRLATDQRRDH